VYNSVHLFLFKDNYVILWYFCTLFSVLFIAKRVGEILKCNEIGTCKYSIKYSTYNDVIKIYDGRKLYIFFFVFLSNFRFWAERKNVLILQWCVFFSVCQHLFRAVKIFWFFISSSFLVGKWIWLVLWGIKYK